MHDLLNGRLLDLRKEYDKGRTRFNELEQEKLALRETLLRISGAIQVLEELLQEENAKGNKPTQSVNGAASLAPEA